MLKADRDGKVTLRGQELVAIGMQNSPIRNWARVHVTTRQNCVWGNVSVVERENDGVVEW